MHSDNGHHCKYSTIEIVLACAVEVHRFKSSVREGVIIIAKDIVRSGIRTHAGRTRLRPERSALDRSAILTY